MVRKNAEQDVVDFLKLVEENKKILFGAFCPNLTAKDKENCWKKIRDDLLASGSTLAADNDWKKLSVNVWQYYRRKTIEKTDKRRKTGAEGGSKVAKWTAVDDLVVAIIGRDSAVMNGLPVPESGEREEDPGVAIKSLANSSVEGELDRSQVDSILILYDCLKCIGVRNPLNCSLIFSLEIAEEPRLNKRLFCAQESVTSPVAIKKSYRIARPPSSDKQQPSKSIAEQIQLKKLELISLDIEHRRLDVECRRLDVEHRKLLVDSQLMSNQKQKIEIEELQAKQLYRATTDTDQLTGR